MPCENKRLNFQMHSLPSRRRESRAIDPWPWNETFSEGVLGSCLTSSLAAACETSTDSEARVVTEVLLEVDELLALLLLSEEATTSSFTEILCSYTFGQTWIFGVTTAYFKSSSYSLCRDEETELPGESMSETRGTESLSDEAILYKLRFEFKDGVRFYSNI